MVSSISSKKWMKTRCIVKMNSFVCFLEEFTAWQFAFEINWPLGAQSFYTFSLAYWHCCLAGELWNVGGQLESRFIASKCNRGHSVVSVFFSETWNKIILANNVHSFWEDSWAILISFKFVVIFSDFVLISAKMITLLKEMRIEQRLLKMNEP